jgi:hypothetical protein
LAKRFHWTLNRCFIKYNSFIFLQKEKLQIIWVLLLVNGICTSKMSVSAFCLSTYLWWKKFSLYLKSQKSSTVVHILAQIYSFFANCMLLDGVIHMLLMLEHRLPESNSLRSLILNSLAYYACIINFIEYFGSLIYLM